jgi:hypothetical protein
MWSYQSVLSEFITHRFTTIKAILGAGKFEAAIAKKLAECQKRFADAEKEDQEIESLAPCRKCGTKPYLDGPLLMGTDETGLCCLCIEEELRKTPCTVCGAKGVLASIEDTGGLCRGCASEALAPCANCGGKRSLRSKPSALCDACLEAAVPPCKYCGATRYPSMVDIENDHGYCHECTW